MRIAICDDVLECTNNIKEILENYFEAVSDVRAEIFEFQSGAELLQSFPGSRYDIIFLDISMPDIDGLETASRIRLLDLDVIIVFITFLNEYMPKAFRVMASDFIIKPVTHEQLKELMDRLLSVIKRKQNDTCKIRLKGGGDLIISLTDVLFMQSDRHYIRAITIDNEYEFMNKLTEMETQLINKGFVRTHQSYLVNMAHVFIIFEDYISLTDGTKIPVSRKYSRDVIEAYDNFRKGVK